MKYNKYYRYIVRKINEYIKIQGISVRQFAKSIGMNLSTIYRFLNFNHKLSEKNIQKIIDKANLDTYFFSYDTAYKKYIPQKLDLLPIPVHESKKYKKYAVLYLERRKYLHDDMIAIRIQDDAMYPKYCYNDTAVFKMDFMYHGQGVYLIWQSGNIMIREVCEKGKFYIFRPYNTEYGTEIIEIDKIKIIGKLIRTIIEL